MRNAYTLLLSTSLLFATGCSTMNESLQLGSGMGALAGAAATYAGHRSKGDGDPEFRTVATGAGIGMILGLITSHLTHQAVDKDRHVFTSEQTEMHFGDLPPSPFVIPKNHRKGGR